MVNLIYHKNRQLTIAENWDEVTTEQYIAIAKVLHAQIERSLASDRILKILSGKNLFSFLMLPLHVRMNAWDHVQWVIDDIKTTKQMLPVYKGLYGPESEFLNLRIVEFHHTEIAWQKWINEDPDGLDELVAVLYREPKKHYDKTRNREGDIRIAFHHGDIEFHKQLVNKWPAEIKQAIAIWYDACRQQLVKDYEPAFAGSGSDDNYYQGLYGMIRSIAGSGRYGPFEEVEEMYVHAAFLEIVACFYEEEKLKEMYPDLYK